MAKARKFGAFSGVFTPSILTILGVIMYLRLPKIVGEAGLYTTLAIIAVAHVISFTTGLSVASIATDRKVEAGGTYYMISRSLGLPIGGALGLALFFGLSLSVSLYLIGFSESFLGVTGFEVNQNAIRITGSAVLLAITLITFISSELAIKTQFIIMGAIILSLLSILIGRHEFIPEVPLLGGAPRGNETFISLFGIFFPAVTGFEAGVSMSGDLKDPKKAIPRGTISAIVTGFIVYVGLAFFFSYTVQREMLISDPRVLSAISWFSPLVVAGIWGATLSSAIGSILASPRILQATALDRISPRFFAKGYGPANEPRNALLLTFLIAEAGILVGELDVIARVISIFFITTYGFLNLSCAFESWTGADFRPEFKIPVWVSVVGAIACFIVMLELDIVAMAAATVLLILLYLVLKRKELRLAGGDAWSGVWATVIKAGLNRLHHSEIHSRNWRPNVIMFHGEMRGHLVEIGKAIAGRHGMLSGFQLIESNVPLLTKARSNISTELTDNAYFEHQSYCRDFFSGIDEIARVYGFSGVEPNTVLMGWSRNEAHRERFVQLIKSLNRNNFNAIYLGYNRQKAFGQYKTIDIWWEGWGRNLHFSISLIKHMFYNSAWKNASVRLLAIADGKQAAEEMHRALQIMAGNQRVRSQIIVINNRTERLSRGEIIARESAASDLTILSLREKEGQTIENVERQLAGLLPSLGTTMIIDASKEFETYGFTIKDSVVSSGGPATEIPVLIPSKYPEAANVIWPLDARGLNTIETFHEKAFDPFIAENQRIITDFGFILKSAFAGVRKALTYQDNYRKRQALSRTLNDFNFHSAKFLDEWKETRITRQRSALEEGLTWYESQVHEELQQVPQDLIIAFDKNDFRSIPGDALSAKLYKLWKKMSRPFSPSVLEKVNFRKAAESYLVHHRQYFLTELLDSLDRESLIFLQNIANLIEKADNFFVSVRRNPEIGKAGHDEYEKDISAGFGRLSEKLQLLSARLKEQMIANFRTNIGSLSEDLNKPAVNITIRLKKGRMRNYHHIKNDNFSFPAEWQEKFAPLINRMYLNAALSHTAGRLYEQLENLKESLADEIERTIIKPIVKTKSTIRRMPEALGSRNDPDRKMQPLLNQIFAGRYKGFVKAVGDLPEQIVALEENTAEILAKQEPHPVEIPARSIAGYFLESSFLGPVQDELENAWQQLEQILTKSGDSLRMARFNCENLDDALNRENLKIILSSLADQVERDEKEALEIRANLILKISNDFSKTFEPLSSTSSIIQTARDFPQYLKDYQSKKTLARMESYRERLQDAIRKNTAKLIYSQSKGTLLARKISGRSESTPLARTLDLVEALSPRREVLDQLPNYYKNLFSGRSSIGNDFWINREDQELRFQKAVDRFRERPDGAIMLLGERNSGKTAFCRYAAGKYFPAGKIYQVYPPRHGSADLKDLETEFRNAGVIPGRADHFEEYEAGSVIIIHDLELWWERTVTGGEVINFIKELIHRLKNRRVLVIMNINPYAYALIDKLYGLKEYLFEAIPVEPFTAEELKDLILLRHFSSRIRFSWNGASDKDISEWRLAKLFNGFFNYSSGNPGDALNAWISSIASISGDRLQIRKPHLPDLSPLRQLDTDWLILLAQLVLHKRLGKDRLKRIFDIDDPDADLPLAAMLRSRLIVERNPDLFIVNPYVEPFITEELKYREFI